MRGSTLFNVAKPVGPDRELIGYEAFARSIGRLDRWSLIDTVTRATWWAWREGDEKADLNEVTRANGPRIAALAMARCGNTGARVDEAHVHDRLLQSLAIESDFTLDPQLVGASQRLWALASDSGACDLLESYEVCRSASIHISLARLFRSQWSQRFNSLDDGLRVWWMINKLDRGLRDGMSRVLSMSPAMFIRTADVLLTCAVDTGGFVEALRGVSAPIVRKYGVDVDAMKLCARNMSINHEDLRDWDEVEVTRHPEEFRQYVTLPFAAAPLFPYRGGLSEHKYVCPSPELYLAAVPAILERAAEKSFVSGEMQRLPDQQRNREDFARVERDLVNQFGSLMGHALEEYVDLVASTCLGREKVFRISEWEPQDVEQADFLLWGEQHGLIVEVKRILASDLAKDLLSHHSVVHVLEKLSKAYAQCQMSFRRRRWRQEASLRTLDRLCALIVVDDAVIAEGGLFSLLLDNKGSVDLYVEVISVAEFERLMASVPVDVIVQLIRRKWIERAVDTPLRLFVERLGGRKFRPGTPGNPFLSAVSQEVHHGLTTDHVNELTWP